jgi:hypothetical protein
MAPITSCNIKCDVVIVRNRLATNAICERGGEFFAWRLEWPLSYSLLTRTSIHMHTPEANLASQVQDADTYPLAGRGGTGRTNLVGTGKLKGGEEVISSGISVHFLPTTTTSVSVVAPSATQSEQQEQQRESEQKEQEQDQRQYHGRPQEAAKA